MKQPLLFEAERSPRRIVSQQKRIAAFKEQYGIWTHRSIAFEIDECRWMALWLRKAHEAFPNQPKEPVALISAVGRLIEDAGWMVEGKGELSVIRELCAKNSIPCDL